MISTIIRLLLSVGLLVMVYKETGGWTVTCLSLLVIAEELKALSASRSLKK